MLIKTQQELGGAAEYPISLWHKTAGPDPAEPGLLTPEILLPVSRSGKAATALPSLSSHRLYSSCPTTSTLLLLLALESCPGHQAMDQVREQI